MVLTLPPVSWVDWGNLRDAAETAGQGAAETPRGQLSRGHAAVVK